MQNLVYFLLRYGHILLFIGLELTALSMVVRYNDTQQNTFHTASTDVTAWVNDRFSSITGYFGLAKVSRELARENAELRKKLPNFQVSTNTSTREVDDSTHNQKYDLIEAKVISNSIASLDNYITLNKGSDEGITKGMGVMTENGIVGIVTSSSRHYAQVISLLNRSFRASVKVKDSNFFGYLEWTGGNPLVARMRDVPKHATISEGDVVVSSGYSALFPEDIIVGKISQVDITSGSNFYDIDVELTEDLSSLQYVYVIKNLHRSEELHLKPGNESDGQ